MDKPLGILPSKVDDYKPQPEAPKAPVTRPPPGKAGKHKLRIYNTNSLPTMDKVKDRRGRSR